LWIAYFLLLVAICIYVTVSPLPRPTTFAVMLTLWIFAVSLLQVYFYLRWKAKP
jgi:hypothetical protein